MFANTFLLTTVIFMGLAFFLMEECRFLIPYRGLLLAKYGSHILLFAVALFANLFAAFYAIGRKVFLKDTGRKLAHLEKQLRSGSLSAELASRLEK